jgi:hypothetical protein
VNAADAWFRRDDARYDGRQRVVTRMERRLVYAANVMI